MVFIENDVVRYSKGTCMEVVGEVTFSVRFERIGSRIKFVSIGCECGDVA